MQSDTDVIVIGAGVAGAAAASVLGRQGVRVTLVDSRPVYPVCFKAEKIEPDQAALLQTLGLADVLSAGASRISHVVQALKGRVYTVRPISQLGLRYHEMANALRGSLPPSVRFVVGRVEDTQTGPSGPRVLLDSGETLTARLVVLASGTATGDLHQQLGLTRHVIQSDQSLAFGFTIARPDRRPFSFEALRYLPDRCDERVSYLTAFRIGAEMRANLFVFWTIRDDCTRRFVQDPRASVSRLLPGLDAAIGPFDIVSGVETGRMDLCHTENYLQPGLVLIGDAFQSSCPSAGDGLSRALNDVEVLCHDCVPSWLAGTRIGVEELQRFYTHPRKTAMDQASIARARRNRQIALDPSLGWRAQRLGRRMKLRLEGWRQRISGDGAWQ